MPIFVIVLFELGRGDDQVSHRRVEFPKLGFKGLNVNVVLVATYGGRGIILGIVLEIVDSGYGYIRTYRDILAAHTCLGWYGVVVR